MVAAGEEMAEFVGEQNRQDSDGEGKAGEESGGIFVEEGKGADKLIEGRGLVVGVGDGELRAGRQTRAERQEKERYGENE
jgi:hypothetical protein